MFTIENGDAPMAMEASYQGVLHQFLVCRVRYLISYRRVLQLTTRSVRTIDPAEFTCSNDFNFDDIFGVKPNDADPTSFIIELRGKTTAEKPVQYFYSSDNRSEILCRLREVLWRHKSLKVRQAEQDGHHVDPDSVEGGLGE